MPGHRRIRRSRRIRDVLRHRVIELPARLVGVEGGQHGEDRPPVLADVHPAARVGTSRSDPFDVDVQREVRLSPT